jgi:hypothetical protein
MRLIISLLLIVITAGIISGCGSLPVKHSEPDRTAIEQAYNDLDLSHGASREDAVIIAQHDMLAKGYDYDWWVGAPTKIDDDAKQNTWTVEFAPKEDGNGSGPRRRSELTLQMLLPYWVTINKDSGKISVVVFRTKQK